MVSLDPAPPEWVQSIQRKADRIVENFDLSSFEEIQLKDAMKELENFQKGIVHKLKELESLRRSPPKRRWFWPYAFHEHVVEEGIRDLLQKADRIVENFDLSSFEEIQLQDAIEAFQKEIVPELECLRRRLRKHRWLWPSRWVEEDIQNISQYAEHMMQKAGELAYLRKKADQKAREIEDLCKQVSQRSSTRQQFTISGSDGGGFTAGQVQKDGYQLRISSSTLPPDMPDTNVSMEYSLTNPLDKPLPEGQDLASGVLHIQPDHDIKLRGRGAPVELQHPMNITSEEARSSVSAVMMQGQGPYENVPKSQFVVGISSAVVWLKEVTGLYLGIVHTVALRRFVSYCGLLYREAALTSSPSLRFHFVVVKDLNPCISAVQKKYASKPELEPLPVTFASANVGEEMKLSLDLDEKGVTTDGWYIIPAVFPPEIQESDAYSYLPNSRRKPLCELDASWRRVGIRPGRLKHSIKLKGTKRPKSFLIGYEPAEESHEYQLKNIAALHRCRSEPGLCDSPANKFGSMPHLSCETTPLPSADKTISPLENVPRLRRQQSLSQLDAHGHDEMKTTLLKRCNSSPHVSFSPKPTMPELVKFSGPHGRCNICEEIGMKYDEFGILLLEDTNGAIIQNTEGQYHHAADWINREILKRWIRGEGKQPVTWETLVDVLRDIQMNSLADDIEVIKLKM